MKIIKRVLLVIVALVVLVVVVGFVGFMKLMNGPNKLPEHADYEGGAFLVNDSGRVGVYVIPIGDGHAIQIDCGNDTDAKAQKAALAEHKLVLDGVFVTHGHIDHIGSCKALGAPIYALEAERELMKGDVAAKGKLPAMFGPSHLNVAIDHVLADDVVVNFGANGAVQVHVYALPGHTAGSAAYLVNGVLYFGDGANNDGDGVVGGPIGAFSDDAAQGKDSLRKLAARLQAQSAQAPVKTFAFGHTTSMPADLAKLAAVQ